VGRVSQLQIAKRVVHLVEKLQEPGVQLRPTHWEVVFDKNSND